MRVEDAVAKASTMRIAYANRLRLSGLDHRNGQFLLSDIDCVLQPSLACRFWVGEQVDFQEKNSLVIMDDSRHGIGRCIEQEPKWPPTCVEDDQVAHRLVVIARVAVDLVEASNEVGLALTGIGIEYL